MINKTFHPEYRIIDLQHLTSLIQYPWSTTNSILNTLSLINLCLAYQQHLPFLMQNTWSTTSYILNTKSLINYHKILIQKHFCSIIQISKMRILNTDSLTNKMSILYTESLSILNKEFLINNNFQFFMKNIS